MYRYLLTVLVVGMLGYGWYVGIYTKIDQLICHYRQDLQRMHHDKLLGKNSKAVKQLEQSLHEARRDVLPYLPGNTTVTQRLQASMVSFLDTLQQHGLQLSACTLEREHEQEDMAMIDMACSFTGSFDQLAQAMTTLSRMPILITWQQLSLNRQNDGFFGIAATIQLAVIK